MKMNELFKSQLTCYEEQNNLNGDYTIHINNYSILKNYDFNKYIYLTFNIISDIYQVIETNESAKYEYFRLIHCRDKLIYEAINLRDLMPYMKSYLFHKKRDDLLSKYYLEMSKINWDEVIKNNSQLPTEIEVEILKQIIENMEEVNNENNNTL